MSWIVPEDRMPPEGLHVLLEVSGMGTDEHKVTVYADHSYYIGCWIIPDTGEGGFWLLQTSTEFYDPTVHAWMPLPKHFEPQQMFHQEPDLMEHAPFEDEPDWLYKGDAVYEQMTLEDFLGGTT